MKQTFVLCSLFAALTLSAQTPSKPDPKLIAIIQEVQKLMSEQRSAEALLKLEEGERITPDSPLIYNIRGTIYTSPPLRDFAKAKEAFEHAKKFAPAGAFEPQFNLTELLYVQGQFAEAEKEFARLLKDNAKLRQEIRHLLQFKILVCQLKQDKSADAEKSLKSFSYLDDTPAFYFSKAAIAFQQNNEAEAKDWIAKAQRIFKPKDNSVYIDTLMEARWIPSVAVPEPKNP